MRLAFYYHIPLVIDSKGCLCTVSFFGVFLDSLAMHVDYLYLCLHEGNPALDCSDYTLKAKNIEFVSLGPKEPAWKRALFPNKVLSKIRKKAFNFDFMLVRAPSPLAPHLSLLLKRSKVWFLVVGDYSETAQQREVKSIRDIIIKWFLFWSDNRLSKAIQNGFVFVNSNLLKLKYHEVCSRVVQVKTTTLVEKDIILRKDSFGPAQEVINILFSGRIDFQKGIKELLLSVAELRAEGYNVKLNIVGWEEDIKLPVERSLKKIAEHYSIEKDVIFHGLKKVGPELYSFYRSAQLFVLPTYHEGFPRTIWEAMAAGTPVIATTVGSIPYNLESGKDSILIPPKNKEAIITAIKQLISNQDLRQSIIANAYNLVNDATLENQSKKIIDSMLSNFDIHNNV